MANEYYLETLGSGLIPGEDFKYMLLSETLFDKIAFTLYKFATEFEFTVKSRFASQYADGIAICSQQDLITTEDGIDVIESINHDECAQVNYTGAWRLTPKGAAALNEIIQKYSHDCKIPITANQKVERRFFYYGKNKDQKILYQQLISVDDNNGPSEEEIKDYLMDKFSKIEFMDGQGRSEVLRPYAVHKRDAANVINHDFRGRKYH